MIAEFGRGSLKVTAAGLISLGMVTAGIAQTLQLPVGPRPVSSGFFDPNYPPTQARQHLGTDFTAPVGTAVYSPVDGTIVTNATGAADVMEAYLVIRSRGGPEHVLGHIASALQAGASIRVGQQVGTVRAWPGQPSRSHVHWGINRLGIAQAMSGGWGWGRAPVTATRSQAQVKGWIGTASSSN